MIEPNEAIKAVETIKKYCLEKTDCKKCQIEAWCDIECKDMPERWDIPGGDEND